MKKIIIILLISIISACSSSSDSGDDTASTLKVNLIGTWDYSMFSNNSVCDGLVAKGIITVNSLNGDLSKIGTTSLQGEGFDIDRFGNCVFITLDETDTSSQGRPSEQTANDWLKYTNEDNAGDNTIKGVRLDSFNATKIIEVTDYTNGVTITFAFTR